jgi:glycerol-3-phosphate dehydrogenase (NAD(P)+)
MTTVSVIGAGAWGAALAMVAERSKKEVTLYTHTQQEYDMLHNQQETPKLPGIKLPGTIRITTDLALAAQANVILMVVPAQVMRTAVHALSKHLNPNSYLILCSKGIELDTGLLMSEVVEEILPSHSISVFSGPTFAREVATGLPTIATLASREAHISRWLASSLSNGKMRIYTSMDTIGLQIAGALKNVIAIASGISTARELGENARAALITRGLAEMTRLGLALGAQEETFQGLAGIGDLLLSATSVQSRNFSLGLAIGGNKENFEAIGLTEGAFTARAVLKLAQQVDVEMPICQAVCNILDNHNSIDAEIAALWARPLKSE